MNYLSEAEKKQITNAIKAAERNTSGEIKVHIEEHCPVDDPVERAKEIFYFLCLDNTAFRNGVLFYVAFAERKYAILGDIGIHEKCGDDLWQEESRILVEHFSKGETVEGLSIAIERVGQELKNFFPYDQKGDTNELSDEISFS